MSEPGEKVKLPDPLLKGKTSVEQLLAKRRSIREYPDKVLALAEVGQLLWSAQGITHPHGYRTAPSAGALYPLELYIAVGQVEGLVSGVYHYQPQQHQLVKTSDEDVRQDLSNAAWSQDSVEEAAAVIIFTADYARTTGKYGKRGKRYVHIEVGHAAENLFLQAEALQLATVVIGAFSDHDVEEIVDVPDELQALLLMPVGRK